MDHISQLMADDHRACDLELAAIEQAVKQGDWALAARAVNTFVEAMERHLGAEETVLFPAFEAATGSSMGPTRVMRMEHTQMRGLFDDLKVAVARADAENFRGEIETLLILMQQHNLKEENILYPMCDGELGTQAGELCQTLGAAVARS